MTRRQWLAAATCLPAASKAQKPNILFLSSDQHSSDMLGCYGNRQVITPHLDKLASEGVRFRHCISNTPVCSPFRAMLMSGQHPLYNGVFVNDIHVEPGNGKHLAEILRDAGYRTGYVGKWHLYGGDRNRPIPAGPDRLGFDDTFLSDNCTLQFGAKDCYYWNENGVKTQYGEWQPYGQARQAMSFLDRCTPDEPFALFLSVHPPHNFGGELHYAAEPDLMGLYDAAKIQLRPNVAGTQEVRDAYRGYMAMCTGVDRAFGQILDKLKEKGLDQNTIVVFSADHGDLLRSHGRPWPKSFPESESSRVPLLVRWPGHLRAGSSSELLIGALDLMPTLLGLIGMDIPGTCQGKNLSKAIIAGDGDTTESVPLFYFDPGWRGVYTKRYTYSFGEPGLKSPISCNVLYDREADPYEQQNLFDSANHRRLKKKLHEQTLSWMSKFGDAFPTGAELMKLCFNAPSQQPVLQISKTGKIPGRPIDLLKKKSSLL